MMKKVICFMLFWLLVMCCNLMWVVVLVVCSLNLVMGWLFFRFMVLSLLGLKGRV